MRRLLALTAKEFCQIRRDPSSLLLAFVIPVIMILLFGFCINLDSSVTRLALVLQDEAPATHQLVERLSGSPNFVVERAAGEPQALRRLQMNEVAAVLIIPQDFAATFARGGGARLLLATDGSSPNTAQFSAAYVQGVFAAWAAEQGASARGGIRVETSYRFNPTADSPHSLLPATVAMVLSFVGSFLTAMVVAREWERGTMELVLASPATRVEFVLSKIIPYFTLGMVAMGVCVFAAVFIFGVPLRAPAWQPFAVAAIFLLSVLSIGLLISTLTRNQYTASLLALVVSLLPTMLLSGFVFEVSSMPVAIQAISYIIPACYFVPTLSTLFLAGGLWGAIWADVLALAAFGLLWVSLVILATPHRLDS